MDQVNVMMTFSFSLFQTDFVNAYLLQDIGYVYIEVTGDLFLN